MSAIRKQDLAALAKKVRHLELLRSRNRLAAYQPYPKQLEFHVAGKIYSERLLMAMNQSGKTFSAGHEVAMHLTGKYPDWWEGWRFNRPNYWLAGSESGEMTRRGIQRTLLGRDFREKLGTGTVPYNDIVGITMARGVSDLIDTLKVRHISGGQSAISLKAYEQGRTKWQAETCDGVWLDEEPPADIYWEAMARLMVVDGPLLLTFTPLKGMSAIVSRYLEEKPPSAHVTQMGLYDVPHYSAERAERMVEKFPKHERQARLYGTPALGDGAVFPPEDEEISCAPFGIPDHWPRIAAMDFGWDHPTACAWLAHDRDTDTVYLYDCYAAQQTAVPVHASAIKARGEWIPVAWPHDGNNDTAIGANLASQYRKEGLNMLHEHAQFEAVSGTPSETRRSLISVEAGIQDMLTRMLTGRFKVFNHLQAWFSEKRLYRREKGKLVKLDDDRISATRYGIMMLRYAATKEVEAAGKERKRRDWRNV